MSDSKLLYLLTIQKELKKTIVLMVKKHKTASPPPMYYRTCKDNVYLFQFLQSQFSKCIK